MTTRKKQKQKPAGPPPGAFVVDVTALAAGVLAEAQRTSIVTRATRLKELLEKRLRDGHWHDAAEKQEADRLAYSLGIKDFPRDE